MAISPRWPQRVGSGLLQHEGSDSSDEICDEIRPTRVESLLSMPTGHSIVSDRHRLSPSDHSRTWLVHVREYLSALDECEYRCSEASTSVLHLRRMQHRRWTLQTSTDGWLRPTDRHANDCSRFDTETAHSLRTAAADCRKFPKLTSEEI